MTSDPKNMGYVFRVVILKQQGCTLRKIVILIMATANLHINELNLNFKWVYHDQ